MSLSDDELEKEMKDRMKNMEAMEEGMGMLAKVVGAYLIGLKQAGLEEKLAVQMATMFQRQLLETMFSQLRSVK